MHAELHMYLYGWRRDEYGDWVPPTKTGYRVRIWRAERPRVVQEVSFRQQDEGGLREAKQLVRWIRSGGKGLELARRYLDEVEGLR